MVQLFLGIDQIPCLPCTLALEGLCKNYRSHLFPRDLQLFLTFRIRENDLVLKPFQQIF